MAKTRAMLRCASCGAAVAKWVGRCPECQSWGTVSETSGPGSGTGPAGEPARPISAVDGQAAVARSTGVDELDRVLGGGLVPGSVVLLAGEPGVGKSTLLLEVASRCAGAQAPALIVTGEESAPQVRRRAQRIGALAEHLFLATETDVAALLGHVEAVRPALLVVDSVQTFASPDVDGAAGGLAQVREVTAALIRVAKARGMAVVAVGHVTKDGAVAGPRSLEHLVDVVLHVDGDRHGRLRVVRAVKNRFGPTDEIGCFELTEDGIWGLPDPSGLFLSRRSDPVPGTCVTVALEGSRPLLVEVQALVAPTQAPLPRRVATGLDASRLAMLLAVLGRRAGVVTVGQEVYAATVGGVRLGEPAADLAVALSVAGAVRGAVVPAGVVAMGEVGLGGEVRGVPGVARRLSEAARLGFRAAVVPTGQHSPPDGMRVFGVGDLPDALGALQEATVGS